MEPLAFDGSQSSSIVGHYTYLVAEDLWIWSDGLYELHGYAPQALPATTELMLKHKHPDDTARAFEVLETAMHDGRPFSCYHRIVDSASKVRSVLSVGHGELGSDGNVEKVTGFFVDLTEVRRNETQSGVEDALVHIAETRSFIEQAKGMLMVTTGCDADAAFGVLRNYSSHKNVKVNDLARRMVEWATEQPRADEPAGRTAVLDFLDGVQDFSTRAAG
jgi:ANTAR domain-containing protein/PAS domain-containing protein